MKKIIVLILIITSPIAKVYCQQDTTMIKKLAVAFAYSFHTNLDMKKMGTDLVDYTMPSTINSFEKKSEELKAALSKITLDSDLFFNKSAYLTIPSDFFRKKDAWQTKFVFDKVLDQNNVNIVEPYTVVEFSADGGSKSFVNDDLSLTAAVKPINLETPIYSVEGKVLLTVPTGYEIIEFNANEIAQTKKIGNTSITLGSFKNGTIKIEMPEEIEGLNFIILNKDGKKFNGTSSVSGQESEVLNKYFDASTGTLSEKQLEEIAKKISLNDLKIKKEGFIKKIFFDGTPAKLLIIREKELVSKEFPFVAFAKDVKLKKAPIQLRTLNLAKNLTLDGNEEVIADDTDIYEITSLQIGYSSDGTHLENDKEVVHTMAALTNLPDAIIKFENLEEIKFGIGRKADIEGIFNKLKQLKYLKSITIESHESEIELEEGEMQAGLYYIPKSIGEITSLERLNFSNNWLISIPDEISKLTNLTSLVLSGNHIERISNKLLECVKLESLDLSSNDLKTLPEKMNTLSNLSNLDISSNYLSVLPKTIFQIENLSEINVSSNNLEAFSKTCSSAQLQKLSGIDNQEDRKIEDLDDSTKVMILLIKSKIQK